MNCLDERFADIQLLRYTLDGFERLSLQQKLYIYYLAEATLWGRDITFDQHCRHNLDIRQSLEAVIQHCTASDDSDNYQALSVYLRQVWFASGIHHHYGCEKFRPHFSPDFLTKALQAIPAETLPLQQDEDLDSFIRRITRLIFDETLLPRRVNLAQGEDLVLTSACNFYDGVSQHDAETFYQKKKDHAKTDDNGTAITQQPSWGLNSTLVAKDGKMYEEVWRIGGKYGETIVHIIDNLLKARQYAENEGQRHIIDLLVDYYRTGDLTRFDDYSIAWTQHTEGSIDFINGFIEVYGDPLGIKGTWEGIVHYVDEEATRRTTLISSNAQWFEDHSPVDGQFKKEQVTGITAHVVRAAMLGGEEYPATAIGINLPNADWIRAAYGSKSISISNIVDAYNKAAHGNGFYDEFITDPQIRQWVEDYGNICDRLHTDLHECVGHGSGKLLPGVDPNALKAYASTIEETRADLFGLYFMADPQMLALRLLPHPDAYKAHYYTYLMNGLMTQMVRIKPGHCIEESHMRNRALIARWLMAHSHGNIILKDESGKTTLHISDYIAVRTLIAQLLNEIQRIKSEGDYDAAQQLVETYAIHVPEALHEEVLKRYGRLHIAPYKGFINPRLSLKYDKEGVVVDVEADYSESYTEQMLRYSKDYSALT